MHPTIIRNQRGQGLAEYSLIIFLIALVVIVSLSQIAPQLVNVFNQVAAAF